MESTTDDKAQRKQKPYNWPVIAVIAYFIALFIIFTKIGVLIAIAELAFFVTSLKAISDMNMGGSVLKGIGVLGLVAFLGLWGFAELISGVQYYTAEGIVVSESMMWLGMLTIFIAAYTYYELKYRRQKAYKEKKIEEEAYIKRKGELQAENEYKVQEK